MVIDHIGLAVSDYDASKDFFSLALKPLGITLLMEIQGYAGFGTENSGGPIANFWIHQSKNATNPTHIAFLANNREMVNQFYEAAISAGGKDNGKPGIREIYHPNYYGAFVLDPDGHNIEAVCHKPE